MENGEKSFEEEFRQRVKAGAADENVEKAKKKKDWVLIGALVLAGVVIVGWIVWLVVSGRQGESAGGDGESIELNESDLGGSWNCNDGAILDLIAEEKSFYYRNAFRDLYFIGNYSYENGKIYFNNIEYSEISDLGEQDDESLSYGVVFKERSVMLLDRDGVDVECKNAGEKNE